MLQAMWFYLKGNISFTLKLLSLQPFPASGKHKGFKNFWLKSVPLGRISDVFRTWKIGNQDQFVCQELPGVVRASNDPTACKCHI